MIDAYKLYTKWVGGRPGAGLIKVGYTDRDVDVRIKEQLNAVKMPASTPYDLLLAEAAITDDGGIHGPDVHRALTKAGVHRVNGEWFGRPKPKSAQQLDSVKAGAVLENLRPQATFGASGTDRGRGADSRVLQRRRPTRITLPISCGTPRCGSERPSPPTSWPAVSAGHAFWCSPTSQPWKQRGVKTYRHADFIGWQFKAKMTPAPDTSTDTPLVWFASFQDVLGTDEDREPEGEEPRPLRRGLGRCHHRQNTTSGHGARRPGLCTSATRGGHVWRPLGRPQLKERISTGTS